MSREQRGCGSAPEAQTKRRNATRDVNRERVRQFFVTHPGATRKDVARGLGLNASTVCKHVSALRAEWRGKAGTPNAECRLPTAQPEGTP